jgi:REP element-mobilizing transposase RayT
MPSHLKRYHTEGSYHFITFSCYQRAPLLNNDHARATFEEILERTASLTVSISSATSSCPNTSTC